MSKRTNCHAAGEEVGGGVWMWMRMWAESQPGEQPARHGLTPWPIIRATCCRLRRQLCIYFYGTVVVVADTN